ncbi:MAG: dTDP-4-dehydrorhamnose reductase [Myxococcales bacterium]|nr:dTDP-4-dehydrorhamnose reductase [Myxococcales bacterium]
MSPAASASAASVWLVTGAAGQLGRSLLAVGEEFGIRAVGRTRGELDIGDARAIGGVLDELRPEVVVNCAAFTKVDLCETRPDDAQLGNARGPETLAQVCSDRARLVHLSTEYVFGGDGSTPIPEDADPDPRSEYGRSKLAGEVAVRKADPEALIVRTQWVFGPGPNFVRTILAAARERRELRVVEDQVGRPTWTGALARAIVQAVELNARGTLHLASSGVASWYDFALEAIREARQRGQIPEVAVRPVTSAEFPRPAARPAFGVLGLDRARELGIELPHWRDGLCRYLDAEMEERDA